LAVLAEQTEISLIHLALAFVIQHPAVTAPIIGPRTMQHLESQLGAVDVTLSTDVLDRIDEIVPPGVTLSRSDAGYLPPHYQIRSCAAAAPPESCHVQPPFGAEWAFTASPALLSEPNDGSLPVSHNLE
jgi:hypothetical protein